MAGRSSRQTRAAPQFAGTRRFESVGDWLRFAVTTFSRAPLTFAQGLHGPQEEALILVSRSLGLEPNDLSQLLGCRLTPDETREIKRLITRRVRQQVPVPYLINEAQQAGLRFFVDDRVLIPRSYLAALIAEGIPEFAGPGWHPLRILDVGTGSGCLAIIAARAFPAATVDAIDVSLAALEVAAENVTAYDLEGRVRLLQSDLLAGVGTTRYDLIIANPPYEPSALVQELPPELRHEPPIALDGGDDGMDCVRRILRDARAHLTARGVLLLELGGLREIVQREFPALRFRVPALPDGSDAVISIHARDLPAAAAATKRRRK